MPNTLEPSTPSTTASPSTRRSTRPKRSSDTPKPTPASSVGDTGTSGSKGTSSKLGDSSPRRKNMITPSNPHPWMHPQELRYICDQDFPQNILIQYLCSKAFSIPPREANSTISLFQVTTRHGTTIGLPRGYRVPLMFVSKFQWDSLKLVLTSPDPQKEWDEYKFDIVHLCRLCERLFVQATEAQKQLVATGAKGIDRLWRSATFDRVLTRFYHRWFVSREWSIRKFWEEFDDDEYDGDKLKHDWARWALKGHKGFTLTKDQIQRGITAQQFMHGLSKNPQGTWIWDESRPLSTTGPLDSQPSFLSTENDPIVVEDQPNSNGITIAQLEKVFDVRMSTGTPSHNTIEVKKERLEVAGESLPTVDKPEALLPVIVPTVLESSHSNVVTISVVNSTDAMNTISTLTPLGAPERSTSPIAGQKRPRSPASTEGRKSPKVMRRVAWKTCRKSVGYYTKPKARREKSSSFGNYLQKFKQRESGQLFEHKMYSDNSDDSDDSSSDGDEESSSADEFDDPNDGDYRGPRKSRAKVSQLPSKSDSTARLGQASNTPPLPVVLKTPTTSGTTYTHCTGSSLGVSAEVRVIPAPTKAQGSPSGVVPSSTFQPNLPNTPNVTSQPKLPVFPITDQVTGSITTLATASSEALGSTATTTQALSSSAEALSTSESRQSAPTLSAAELTQGALPPPPGHPPPQDDIPMVVNSSNQEISASPVPNISPTQDAPTGKMDGDATLTIVTLDVVDTDSSVDRHDDIPEYSVGAEPRTSPTIDTETPPVISLGVSSLASSSTPKQVDRMDVDESVPTSDPVEDLHGMLASLLSDPKEAKVQRAIFLLRGLLRDQQIQSGSIRTTVDGEDTFIPVHHPLSSSNVQSTFTDGEEGFIMEEHLELVVKCSSLLSKYITVYKGRELEERMIELDGRLQQELSDRGLIQHLVPKPVGAGNRSPVRIDKEVATMVSEDHSDLEGQGQGIMEVCQVEKPDGIMKDPVTDITAGQSLTPEATMVDFSSGPPTTASTGLDILKIELVSGTIPPAARLMTSMMRNLADLLDCTCGGDNNDVKGKGRAKDAVSKMTTGSPLVGTLLDGFTSMTEEVRKSQQRGDEGIESIARLVHRAEVISLKEQIRATEDKYWRDAELLRQRHREEMDSLIGSLCEAEKQREKGPVEAEGRLPSLEMLELRRRVAALENHTRSITHSPSQAGPSSRPACEDESDITTIRRPPFHPLGHLFDYEDAASPDGVTSASKPGTPIQSESWNAIFFDNIPLPIKSQRKFQRMSLT